MLQVCETSNGKSSYRRKFVLLPAVNCWLTAQLTDYLFKICLSREVSVGSLFHGNQIQTNLPHLGLLHLEVKAV
jgi:hypothetical protein